MLNHHHTNNNNNNNNKSKRSSMDQEHLQYWPEAVPHQGLQARDHYLPAEHLNMPEAKFAPKHLPLSPGDDAALDLVHPIPKPTPTLYLSTSNFAPFDANPKRETVSPFDTDPGLTNHSAEGLSFFHAQSSPDQSSVGTMEDSYTSISSTHGAITPHPWSSSASLSSSSSSTSSYSSSSASSPPYSKMPCTWNPHLQDPATAPAMASGTGSTWSTNMPCSLPNGTQYYNPQIVNTTTPWDSTSIPSCSSTNEEMMMLFNGLPWLDVQNESASPSCLLNPYGPEMDVSFHGYPGVSTAAASATTVGDVTVSRLNPHPYTQSHHHPHPHPQTIYGTPITTTTNTTMHPRPRNPTNSTNASSTSATMPNTKNALLIEYKRRGLSYKDIKRMGNFREAESTLRGRFRTLTKSKDQRVRKPQWQERDIRLLCEAVNVCSSETNPPTQQPHPHTRSLSSTATLTSSDPYNSFCRLRGCTVPHGPQQPGAPKISWKRVAQYIWTHGGSYHFGNATCKKKWCEVHNFSSGS